jgi:hypothetical protein
VKDPDTVAEHGRTISAELNNTRVVSSASEAQSALGTVANMGRTAASLASTHCGDAASIFRPGTIAGSNSGEVISFGQLGQPMDTSVAVDANAFQGLIRPHALTEDEKARISVNTASEPAKKSPRGASAVSLAGVTGELLVVRQEGLLLHGQIKSTYAKASGNMASKVKSAYTGTEYA